MSVRPRSAAGFTLIEILVSMTIALVSVGAALAILSAQNAVFTRQSGMGSVALQAQTALDAIERAVRLAGTGIDPQMAFDFDFYGCTLPGAGLSMTESANCATQTRDSRAAPDELVLAYRDPGYSVARPTNDTRSGCFGAASGNADTYVGKVWGVTAATAGSVTITLKPGDTIYRGQVLMLACTDGQSYTYATVSSAKSSVAAKATGCSSTTLNLYANTTRDLYNQPGFLTTACFSSGTARAYAVRRQRFFIHRELVGPNPGMYLMLDQGLDLNDDGKIDDLDLLPIASDIEDLQVAYATEQPGIMTLPAAPTGWVKATYVKDSDANGVWGDDPTAAAAEQLTEPVYTGAGNVPTAQFDAANSALFAGVGQRCTGSASNGLYQYPCLFGLTTVEASSANNIHAYRWPAWPGNISEVFIGVVARAPVIELNPQSIDFTIPALLNRPAASAPSYTPWYLPTNPGGRRRESLLTSVRPANMAISRMFWN